MIAGGSPAILAACKVVDAEAAPYLYKEGLCRRSFNLFDGPGSDRSIRQQSPSPLIQHFQILLITRNPYGLPWKSYFGLDQFKKWCQTALHSPCVPRKTCFITVLYDVSGMNFLESTRELHWGLQYLKNFDEVTLQLIDDANAGACGAGDGLLEDSAMDDRLQQPEQNLRDTVDATVMHEDISDDEPDRPEIRFTYPLRSKETAEDISDLKEDIISELAGHLGPSCWHVGDEGDVMFRPRDYRRNLLEKGERQGRDPEYRAQEYGLFPEGESVK